jgi:hypothetical protein
MIMPKRLFFRAGRVTITGTVIAEQVGSMNG